MSWKREGIKDEQIGEQILRLGQSERQVRNSVPQLGISKGPNTQLEVDALLVTHRRPLAVAVVSIHMLLSKAILE